jgi:pimeloyl-ACP methyl ester carboxylesterase
MMDRMYQALKASRSRFVPVRHLSYHVREWGTPRAGEPPLVLVHGWMDVAASWQFMVDALRTPRWIVAPDWRGYGLTKSCSGPDRRPTTSGFPTTWPTWTSCSTTLAPGLDRWTWWATAWAATWP